MFYERYEKTALVRLENYFWLILKHARNEMMGS